MLGRSRYSPIGVSITAARLHLVQVRWAGGRGALHRAVALPRLAPGADFGPAEAARLRDVLERRGFAGTACVVGLPNGDLIRSLVEVTAKPEDVVLKAAQEVERTFALPPGEYELAAWLPTGAQGRRTTAVCVNGCRHDVAHKLIVGFERAGLELVALDSRACAVSRVIEDTQESAQRITAVLDLDHAGAELVLLSGGQVIYQRALLDVGLDRATRRLTDAGLDPATAAYFLTRHGLGGTDDDPSHARLRQVLLHYGRSVLAECQPALEYAARLFTGLPVERFALVGDGADVPVLEYELRQQLRLRPVDPHPAPFDGPDGDRAFAVALGLAIHPQEVTWAAA